MNCPDCGAYVGEEDLFCGECGRPFPKERPTGESLLPEEAKEGDTEVPALLLLPAPSPIVPPSRPQSPPKASRLAVLAVLVVGLFGLASAVVAVLVVNKVFLPTQAGTTLTPGVVVYQDDFEDPTSGWSTGSDDDTEVVYQDGEYRVSVFRENYVAWGNPEPALDLGDFEIEVDARAVEGPLDNNLGILVRYQDDEEDFYWFQISSDGYFSVDRLAGDDWVTVAGWQEADAIRQGLGTTNRLKVSCSGDRFIFSVNDTYLGTVTDENLGPGNIGLAAGTFAEPGTVVYFDNLRVYALEE
jgi:hypothetical protein